VKTARIATCLAFVMMGLGSSAAAQAQRVELVLSGGGAAGFALPSFEDRWSAANIVDDPFTTRTASASARYLPATPIGVNGGAAMWVDGLGLFVEYEKLVHDLDSAIAADVTIQRTPCPRCPVETISIAGRVDSEKFERDEGRLHLGAGYRIRLGGESYVELTGGATHFSIRQELARITEGADNSCLFTPRPGCTVALIIQRRESDKGSTWGGNAGAAIVKFVNRTVGLGVHARYSRGAQARDEGPRCVRRDGEGVPEPGRA
jgi:hypothetical protein